MFSCAGTCFFPRSVIGSFSNDLWLKKNVSLNNGKQKQHLSRDCCWVKVTQCCVNCVVFISQMAKLLEGSYHDSLLYFRMIDGLPCHLWTMNGQDKSCVIAYLPHARWPQKNFVAKSSKFGLFTRHNARYIAWRGSIAHMECFAKINSRKESTWSKFCCRYFISTILSVSHLFQTSFWNSR